MLLTLLSAIAALPMGDETPIKLLITVGIVAVVLVIVMMILGKKTKK